MNWDSMCLKYCLTYIELILPWHLFGFSLRQVFQSKVQPQSLEPVIPCNSNMNEGVKYKIDKVNVGEKIVQSHCLVQQI